MTEPAAAEIHAFETLGIAPVPDRERNMRPASSHARLPANVYAEACQRVNPAERAKP